MASHQCKIRHLFIDAMKIINFFQNIVLTPRIKLEFFIQMKVGLLSIKNIKDYICRHSQNQIMIKLFSKLLAS